MEWVETTGRNVEEAKEAALDELGVDEQDAEFEVVAEARIGLFGRVRAEARVRARVQPTAPRAKDDRRRKRRRGPSDSPESASTGEAAPADLGTADDGAEDEVNSTVLNASDAPAKPRRNRSGASTAGSRPRSGPSPTSPGRADPVTPTEDAPVDDGHAGSTTETPRPRRNRSGGNRRPSETRSEQRPAATAGSEGPEEDTQVEVALEEQAKVAEAFLQGLVAEMGLTAEIAIKQDGEESVELGLEGQDLGLLIGPKGATLLALQDLTRTVVQRKTGASNGRLWVDVSSYRQKRSAALARFAQQVAAEVVASGSRKAMEPMSAADRKVVHDTVNDIAGVATLSEGEDSNRRVVVYAVTD